MEGHDGSFAKGRSRGHLAEGVISMEPGQLSPLVDLALVQHLVSQILVAEHAVAHETYNQYAQEMNRRTGSVSGVSS